MPEPVISVEVTIALDPDSSPVLKGSAAYLRPSRVRWTAVRYPAIKHLPEHRHVHAYVTGRRARGDQPERRAPGGAGFSDDEGSWLQPIPDWLPRPPYGWLDSLDAR